MTEEIIGVLDVTIDSVDGNCEFDEENETVVIWGDCTITGGAHK